MGSKQDKLIFKNVAASIFLNKLISITLKSATILDTNYSIESVTLSCHKFEENLHFLILWGHLTYPQNCPQKIVLSRFLLERLETKKPHNHWGLCGFLVLLVLLNTLFLAEKGGFEPPVGYEPTHAFQACDLNHSSISPNSIRLQDVPFAKREIIAKKLFL